MPVGILELYDDDNCCLQELLAMLSMQVRCPRAKWKGEGRKCPSGSLKTRRNIPRREMVVELTNTLLRETTPMTRRTTVPLLIVAVMCLLAAPAFSQVKPKVMSHDTVNKEDCLMCHRAGLMEPVPDVPESHAGRTSDVCLWCHATDSPMQTVTPPATTHDTAGRETCLMCHRAGLMEPVPDVPESHAGRSSETCLWCHTVAG